MFDHQSELQVDQEENKCLNRNGVDTLEMLAKALKDGMNVVRKTDIKYEVLIPGLLKIKRANLSRFAFRLSKSRS